MRVTGLGHAGLFIETLGGSVLCDPWVHPAFFGSWFPFPDNRGLDWEKFGKADYLYVSHRHRDHFDPQLLQRYVPTDITVLLPEYPTDDLERDLRALGYTNIFYTKAGEVIERDGLRIMVTPMRAPSDGPVGDSSLSLDDGTAVILDQNDAHPLDLDALLGFGKVDAYFTQFSGAIWWPMAYDLTLEEKQHFAQLKRDAQTKRAQFYITKIDAPHVFPMAGPPMFLDDELFGFNGSGVNGESIFTDQAEFLDVLTESHAQAAGHIFMPGTVVEIEHGNVTVTNELFTDDEIRHMFANKWEYFENQRSTRQAELAAEKASRAPVPADLFEQVKAWWEPLMKRAPTLCDGIGALVRFTIGDDDLVADFPKGEVRRFNDEACRYWFTIPADLVATNLRDHEIDWSNSIFLSVRFQAGRIGKFNEYLYTFMKCLSPERIDYVENWYSEQSDTGEDIRIDDWLVQRRCPHLRADLSKAGTVENGVLTCSLHDWKFDLATGRCLTSHGHEIRASKI
ncbi:MAG: Rieske 2Fe-2S domain-containing protein [Aurantimicrobium sp.]|nr:Rieske 2Fe-2S domain-containing protein [Aurantimicrobium sp.]